MAKKRKCFSYSEIKEKKQRNTYENARSSSCNKNFWDREQQEMYNQIYKEEKVFPHRYVDWSSIANLGTTYEKLGLKDMCSDKSTWKWNKDIVRKFYGTLFISSDRKEMTCMFNSKRRHATKKDLEEALCIKPVDGSLVLHELTGWDKNELSCLYAEPNMATKKVRHLKPEVKLIQKINRWTIRPRTGNRGDCSDILLRLAHAIYTETPFDVADFLLSEMQIVIGTPGHQLPYGPYIFSLLRHLKLINDESIGETCSLTAYSPVDMKKSVAAQLKALIKKIDEFAQKVEKQLDNFDKRIKDVEMLHRGSSDIVFRRRGGSHEATDDAHPTLAGSREATDAQPPLVGSHEATDAQPPLTGSHEATDAQPPPAGSHEATDAQPPPYQAQ